MRLFIFTIFLSAFLLFQVQPMIARFILPVFGGSSAVWSTCLLFFQAGLLLGYGYAHCITKWLSINNQVKVHLILLVVSLISLPIIPREWMIPQENTSPEIAILILLTLSVGFPYVMVSSTGPLLQAWYSTAYPEKSPYRLYALSNFGSLLGLFSYPTLVEPFLKINSQAWYWSGGYFLYILFSGFVAYSIWKLKTGFKIQDEGQKENVGTMRKSLWLLLSFLGVVTLLSATNKLTNDIVVIPFLWVIPLSLYLISFIIVFNNTKWYKRILFLPLLLIIIFMILRLQINYVVYYEDLNIGLSVLLYCLGVFIICTSLHGELAAIKPARGNLTFYYLMMSVGGVLVGVFVSLLAPVIFNGYWEIYCAFIGCVLLIAFVLLNNNEIIRNAKSRTLLIVIATGSIAAILFALRSEYKAYNDNVISSHRNFYGVLKVAEMDNGEPEWERAIFYGDVLHGLQYMQPDKSKIPLTYYGTESGIGFALSLFPSRDLPDYQGIKVGMVGLGTGTVSAYALQKDIFRYYEINPQVETVAREYFKYLGESEGKTEVIIGDGRISLEKELREKGSNQYDVLAIDAFSGDVIPTHLVTREAVDLYMKHLNKNGILAFHVTNKFLDLMPVMKGISEYLKMPLYYFFQQNQAIGLVDAEWVIFTENQEFLNTSIVKNHVTKIEKDAITTILWTDDYSPVLPLFKRKK